MSGQNGQYQGGPHDDLFEQIANRKKGGRRNSLQVGYHKLVLRTYTVERTRKNNELAGIEATFIVLESTCYKPGDVVGHFWYMGVKDEYGFGQERAQEFVQGIAACIGDSRDLKSVGCDLYSPQQFGRGVAIVAKVVQAVDKFGNPSLSKAGHAYTDTMWLPLSNDLAQIAATRRDMESMDASLARPAAPVQPGYQQVAAPTQGYNQPAPQQYQQVPAQQVPVQYTPQQVPQAPVVPVVSVAPVAPGASLIGGLRR